ncbi:pteridine reductase [Niveibacterium sp. SC-1]|uniref:pteridine reductase n=1 Tax=Niveibacterium sp. SC-1 TaxID=3135646 RepID=UPI00311ED1E3
MNERPVVLVTGAARRVGAAIARQLHARGCDIALHYRGQRDAAETLMTAFNDQRPGSAAVFGADLLDIAAAQAMVDAVGARFGRLDGLVNNASSFFPTPFAEVDEAAWQDLVGSNLKAPLFVSQRAAPLLAAQRGAIVNIVDIHAERPMPGYPVYSLAKTGLQGLTRVLAVELAPAVRVNGVAPGAIEWPEDGQFDTEERARIVRQTLLGRVGAASDIAGAVAFLLLDAPYVTGQILAVDGGRSIHL